MRRTTDPGTTEPRNVWPRVRAAALYLAALSALLLVAGTPAGAEIDDPQRTSWGLAVEGQTNNLDRWDALGWATEQVGGSMLVGGKFLEITNGWQRVDQSWIAAFDAGTGEPLTWWRPEVGGAVLAIENSPDGGVFVGGEMGTWNGTEVGALVKIDPDTGERWPGFQTRAFGGNSVVRDIRLEPDGWLYVVGNFTTASDSGNPRTVASAIRMDPVTGAIDWNWLPQVESGGVWGVSVSRTRGEVYLAGWFRSVDGQNNTDGFVGLDATTGAVVRNRLTIPYNTCDGCFNNFRLYDVIATEQGDVWVGGEQHALFILDESDLRLRLMHWTGCDFRQQDTCDRRGGEYQELERDGNRIYGAGHFWGSHTTDTEMIDHFRGDPAVDDNPGEPTGRVSAVAAYDIVTGERDRAFDPEMSGDAGGFAMAIATDGCLWMAGGIDTVGVIDGTHLQGRDLVRLCDEAGPGPDPQPDPAPPAPDACVAAAEGSTVTVDWSVPAWATDVVVERSVDDGAASWRGRVPAPGTTFTETGRADAVNRYQVRARYETGALSPPTECTPDIDLTVDLGDDVAAPASCTAGADGVDATLAWAASDGAVDYRVFRSIDGGAAFWRGRVDVTSFVDTLRATGVHRYEVQARGANGIWSASTTCSPDLDPEAGGPGGDDAAAPASCAATADGLDVNVTWPASDGAVDYRVFRSIDGGQDWWRGRVDATSFADTLRSTGVHRYSVQARGANGGWSDSTMCAPDLDPAAILDGAAPPASCSVEVVGADAVVTWPASDGAVDYRVFRSVDGGDRFWRGRVDATSFTDPLRSGLAHGYSVEARGDDQVWSAATTCEPEVVGP